MDYCKEAKFMSEKPIHVFAILPPWDIYCGCFVLYMLVPLHFLFVQTCFLSGGILWFIIMLRGLDVSDG